MKRLFSILLALALILTVTAFAEIPDISGLNYNELLELQAKIEEALANQPETRAAEAADGSFVEMKKGSKGDDVQKLQERLKELNYLSGSADGDFGGKTDAAVKQFQKEVGMTADGIVTEEVYNALFAADAPKAKVYNSLNFKEISRDPNAFEGQYYKFSGKVLQVIEDTESNGYVLMNLRIATKGSYDNVVYVVYNRPASDKRILEDDKVTVYGECTGLYTYETIMGGTVTLPNFDAETIAFD